MARIRTIKPEFWQDEGMSEVSAESALLAVALLNYADDEGYFKAHYGLVRAGCMPLRETSLSIQDMLQELTDISYIRIGTGDDGKKYGQVVNFAKHQVINRPTKSTIADISITWDEKEIGSRNPHGILNEHSRLEGKGKGKEMERNMEEERECRGKTKKPDDDAELDVSRPVATSRGVKPRASAMKADFELPESWRYWCKTHRPELNPDAVADEFRDYWLGNGKRMIDWQATWRNWVRRQAPPKQSTQTKPRNSGNAGAVTEALERFRHRATIIEGECYDA